MRRILSSLPAILLATIFGALLLAPASAVAGGGSAGDQYIEQVPGAGGDKPSNGGNGGPGGSGGKGDGGGKGSALPSGAKQSLDQLGPDGQAAAGLAAEGGAGPAEGGSAVASDQGSDSQNGSGSSKSRDGSGGGAGGSAGGGSGGGSSGADGATGGDGAASGVFDQLVSPASDGGIGLLLPLLLLGVLIGGVAFALRGRIGRSGGPDSAS